MSRTVGINPKYLAKLSERQRKFILTAVGLKFFDEFITRKGNHLYVMGNTGSGKTQKGYWLVDWLRHTEGVIWISTGKTDEILPLLFMGAKVRIIIPGDSEFCIDGPLDNPPEIIRVKTAGEAWHRVKSFEWDEQRHRKYNIINILEFRNTLSPDIRAEWMAELFSSLAEWTRLGTMPPIFPCSIFIDESQWVLAGTRITRNHERTAAAETVTENALEIRSAGGRLILFAQSHKNITPAIRENMLCAILNRGAMVDTTENPAWAQACGGQEGVKRTMHFQQDEGRFVFDDGHYYPKSPWKFPLFPLDEQDREKIRSLNVRYGRRYTGPTQEEADQEELIPELGRFSAMAIPPEKETHEYSKFDAAGVITDEPV